MDNFLLRELNKDLNDDLENSVNSKLRARINRARGMEIDEFWDTIKAPITDNTKEFIQIQNQTT